MKKNIGILDKTIRIVIAAIIAILVGLGYITGTYATVLTIIGVVLALTGFSNFCPLYTLLGFKTID